MLRKLLRGSLAAAIATAATLALPLAAFAQQKLPAANLVPGGRTLAYFEIMDSTDAAARFAKTDVGQAWATLEPFVTQVKTSIEAYLAEQKRVMEQGGEPSLLGRMFDEYLEGKAEVEKNLGVTVDDILEVLKGGFAIAVVDTAPAGGQPQPVPVAVFPGSSKATVQMVVAKMKEMQKRNGPPLYLLERDGAVVVTVDQNALVATGGSSVLAAGARLSDDAQFQAFKRQAGGAGAPYAFLFVNTAGLLERFAPPDEETKAILWKLGVLDMKAAGIGIGFDGDQLREVIAIASPGEKRGILKILGDSKPVDPKAFAATAPADALAFGVGRLDLLAILDQVTELAKSIDPEAGEEIAGLLAEADEKLGMSLRNDVLATIGDIVIAETHVPEDGLLPETVFAISLRDAQKFPAAWTRLVQMAGFEVKQAQRAGRTIYTMKIPVGRGTMKRGGGDPFNDPMATLQGVLASLLGAWTYEGDKVYFAGYPAALESRFERLAKGTLAQNPAFVEAAARFPASPSSIGWGKAGMYVGPVYDFTAYTLRAFEIPLRKLGLDVDTDLLPRPSQVVRPFRSTHSAVVLDGEGFAVISQGGVPILTPAVLGVGVGAASFGLMAPRPVEPRDDMMVARMEAEIMLHELGFAEFTWKQQKGAYTASIADLVQARLLPPNFEEKLQQSYILVPTGADQETFHFRAMPVKPGLPALELDQTLEVREAGRRPMPPGDDGE